MLIAVVMINAMNFIDGLDGLAAGVGLIAAVAICLFSVGLLHEQGGDVSAYPPAMIAAALAGACLGFLPHNFQPARIFMGDSGSMVIGLMLATVATSASGRIGLSAYGTRDLLGLLTPLLLVGAIMFIPILDLLLAIVRRTRAGRSPSARTRCTCTTVCFRSVTRIAAWCCSSTCGSVCSRSGRSARPVRSPPRGAAARRRTRLRPGGHRGAVVPGSGPPVTCVS